jgi:hypothetical protein
MVLFTAQNGNHEDRGGLPMEDRRAENISAPQKKTAQ